jgi:hypothetical protein
VFLLDFLSHRMSDNAFDFMQYKKAPTFAVG